MVGPYSRSHDYPCDNYTGNLCGGFNAPMICTTCGWDRIYHGLHRDDVDEMTNPRTESFDSKEVYRATKREMHSYDCMQMQVKYGCTCSPYITFSLDSEGDYELTVRKL